MSDAVVQEFTPQTYKTDEHPIWCPGCGDFGVLASLYQSLAGLKLDPKDLVVVSGIGCSGRTPGFVKSYGFHVVHGRVLPVALGVWERAMALGESRHNTAVTAACMLARDASAGLYPLRGALGALGALFVQALGTASGGGRIEPEAAARLVILIFVFLSSFLVRFLS